MKYGVLLAFASRLVYKRGQSARFKCKAANREKQTYRDNPLYICWGYIIRWKTKILFAYNFIISTKGHNTFYVKCSILCTCIYAMLIISIYLYTNEVCEIHQLRSSILVKQYVE